MFDAPPDGWDGWNIWAWYPPYTRVEIWRPGWDMPCVIDPRELPPHTNMVQLYWRRVF